MVDILEFTLEEWHTYRGAISKNRELYSAFSGFYLQERPMKSSLISFIKIHYIESFETTQTNFLQFISQKKILQVLLIIYQAKIFIIYEIMKHMTCVNHKQAEQVCINPECIIKCSYLCLQSNESCRLDHQSCPLASLPFLLRKSNKIIAKAHDFHIEKLINFYSNAKNIMQSINVFLQSYHMLSAIKGILDPHGLLQPKQKETIANFLNSKLKSEKEVSLPGLQRDLTVLNVQLSNYIALIKQERKKNEEKTDRNEGSNRKSSLKSRMFPSAVKSALKDEAELLQVASKIKQKPRQIQNNSKVDRIQVNSIRKHLPKPPFFSKITNDVQTINTFFYHKFTDVKLLYRASQNQFSVAKFHQKCDGFTNTITLLLTQSDKIIGGFTPLPWKSNGQWFSDNSETTFLFSLTSGERYPLVNKDKAIWCSQAFGPSFGFPDLQIADKAFYNSNSCANFPRCFNNGNYTLNVGSTQMFCGTKNGHFKVKEWEVYQLMF